MMNMTETEKTLENQTRHLLVQLGMSLKQIKFKPNSGREGRSYDSSASFGESDEQKNLFVEFIGNCKSLHQLRSFLDFRRRHESGMFLVASNEMTQEIKEKLKDLGIGYYEAGKDLYFPIHIKLGSELSQHIADPIFQKGARTDATVKLLFYLLTAKNATSLTQRELANNLGLSIGTINSTIKNLMHLRVLFASSSGLKLGSIEDIAERWRTHFADISRTKLVRGRFKSVLKNFDLDWRMLELNKFESYWSGEPAASIMTNYLRPEHFTIYTYLKDLAPLKKELKLIPDAKGEIEIVSAFWPKEQNNDSKVVPKLLVHTDLFYSGSDRNREVANMVLKEMLDSLRLKA